MPAENSNRLNILIFILLIGLSLSLLLYLKDQLFQKTGGKEGPNVQTEAEHSTVTHSPGKISSGNIAEQVRRLEQEQRDLDNTVWKSEMISQVHEKVFIDLWDELNRANNKINILAEFPFGKVILGKVSDPQFLENRYTQIHTRGFLKAINPSDAVTLLREYRREGYRIVESEWRHPQFEILPDNRYRSVISMKMFLKKENTRFILQGKLRILWKRSTGLTESPFPEEIDATELTLLKQSTLPAFTRRLYREIRPTYNKKLIDPLLIHDLDGDGLSEIILASANRVFRNLGNLNFKEEALCRLPSKDPYSAIFADLNSDGVTDFICVERNRILMFEGSVDGRFENPGIPIWAPPETMPNPFCLTTGDVDADGDLDIWLAQYKVPYVAGQMPTPFYDANDGFPSYLLINRGDGFLEDATQSSGLGVKRNRRTYSTSFIDLDDDADLDLMILSDFYGIDFFKNDGKGIFTEATEQWIEGPFLFGMGHQFADFNLDGQMDLMAIGMNSPTAQRMDHLKLRRPQFPEFAEKRSLFAYGNRMYFGQNGKLIQNTLSDSVAQTGWSWGVATFDLENDGDPDLHIVNGHRSGRSVVDYERQFWRHDIYAADSRHDPVRDILFRSVGSRLYGQGYSYGGHEKNVLFVNRPGASFLDTAFLEGVALAEDCRNVVSEDLDNDGRMDLIVTTDENWPKKLQSLQVFQNQFEDPGNWIGVYWKGGKGKTGGSGIKATVTLPDGKSFHQVWVNGDSYRSQRADKLHFGLGNYGVVESIRIFWPDKHEQIIRRPRINAYHKLVLD